MAKKNVSKEECLEQIQEIVNNFREQNKDKPNLNELAVLLESSLLQEAKINNKFDNAKDISDSREPGLNPEEMEEFRRLNKKVVDHIKATKKGKKYITGVGRPRNAFKDNPDDYDKWMLYALRISAADRKGKRVKTFTSALKRETDKAREMIPIWQAQNTKASRKKAHAAEVWINRLEEDYQRNQGREPDWKQTKLIHMELEAIRAERAAVETGAGVRTYDKKIGKLERKLSQNRQLQQGYITKKNRLSRAIDKAKDETGKPTKKKDKNQEDFEATQKKLKEVERHINRDERNIKAEKKKRQAHINQQLGSWDGWASNEHTLIGELSKQGIMDHYSLQSIIDQTPKTARQMRKMIEEARAKIDVRERILNRLSEEVFKDGLIPKRALQQITEITDKQLEKYKFSDKVTIEQAQSVLDDVSITIMQHAGSPSLWNPEGIFRSEPNLLEISNLTEAQMDGRTLDSWPSERPIVPSKTKDQVAEESSPGELPKGHEVENGQELAEIVASMLARFETLKYRGTDGSLILEKDVYVVLSQYAKHHDVDPQTIFAAAIQIEESMINEDPTPTQEQLDNMMQAFTDLKGNIHDVETNEFTDPERFMEDTTPFSVDIETHVDTSSPGIHGIGISDSNIQIKRNANGADLTGEQIKQILLDIEKRQNAGEILVTQNGTAFDLYMMGLKAHELKLAMRIALRSVDLLQNLRSFPSFSSAPNTSSKSIWLSLERMTESLELPKKPEEGGYMASLYFKRMQGEKVSVNDLKETSLTKEHKLRIVNEVNDDNEVTPQVAEFKYNRYLKHDVVSNLDIFETIRKRRNTTTQITDANKSEFKLHLQTLRPMWRMNEARSSSYYGLTRSSLGEKWGDLGKDTLATMNQGTGSVEGRGRMYDVNKIQNILERLWVQALLSDPDSKDFAEAMIKTAETALTQDDRATLYFIGLTIDNQNAVKGINKIQFEENGGDLPLTTLGSRTSLEGIPALKFSDATTQDRQRIEYNDSVVSGMREQLKESRSNIETLAESVGFRLLTDIEMDNPDSYYQKLAVFLIEKYTHHKNVKLWQFGDSTIDYAPAESVGRAVIQIMNRQSQGFQKHVSNRKRVNDNEQSRIRDIEKGISVESLDKTHTRDIIRAPLSHEVHAAFPRSLTHLEKMFNEWRYRQRLTHITKAAIENPKEALKALMDLKEIPEEILVETSFKAPLLAPNVNNAGMANQIPDMDQHIFQVTEALLDLPQLAVMFNHDSDIHARGRKIFLDTSLGNMYYKELALSPGSPTSITLLSSVGVQYAHQMTYQHLTKDPEKFATILFDSLKKGTERFKNTSKEDLDRMYSASNAFDYDMNGMHHFAALWLMYTDRDKNGLEEILSELTTVDKVKKIYEGVMERMESLYPLYKQAYRTQEDIDKITAIELWATSDEHAKAYDTFKRVVMGRLYGAGMEKTQDVIYETLNELYPNQPHPIDGDFFAELLYNAKKLRLMQFMDSDGHLVDIERGNPIDSVTGITDEKRSKLAHWLKEELSDALDTPYWWDKMKANAKNSGFNIAGRYMFGLNQVQDAINTRIEWIATAYPQLGSEADIREHYQKRIDNAKEYMDSLPGKRITKEEEYRELQARLLGGEKNYRKMPTLIAMNAMQRTGYDLITEMLETHRENQGLPVHEEHLMGFENFLLYFQTGQDTAGRRLYYYGNHNLVPQNSSASRPVIEFTPEGKDDNPGGMWEITDNELYKLEPEEREKEVLSLIVKDIMIQNARRYAPRAIGYDMAASETRESFFKEWLAKDDEENSAYREGIRDERHMSASELEYRRKNGTPLTSLLRYLMDDDRNDRDAGSVEYVPGAESNFKGFAAWRPMHSYVPWQERGIFALQEAEYNLKAEEYKKDRIQRESLDQDISNPNEIFSMESRGYANPYIDSIKPYVHETPYDLPFAATHGSYRRRLDVRTVRMRDTLSTFAKENGYDDLLEDNEWAKLYSIRESKMIIDRYLHKIHSMDAEEKRVTGKGSDKLISLRREMLAEITGLWEFHHNVSRGEKSYLEFGKMIGVEGSDIQGQSFIEMLEYFADNGIQNLSNIKLGLEPTGNVLHFGDPASNPDWEQKTVPISIQGREGIALRVFHDEKATIKATNILRKKLTKAEFEDLKKDSSGFVLLDEVPVEFHLHIEEQVYKERRAILEEIPLFLFLDDMNNKIIGTYDDIQNRTDTTMAKQAIPMHGMTMRTETSRDLDPNAVYHLTPEQVQQTFLLLRNQAQMNVGKMAHMTRSEIGVAHPDHIRFMEEEGRRFYDGQRMFYSEEMDVLVNLHAKSDSPLKTIDNTNMVDDVGLPLVVYDAVHYVASKEVGGNTAVHMAYQGYVNQAIHTAVVMGFHKEARKLRQLLKEANTTPHLLEAVILLSQHGELLDRTTATKRLRAHFGYSLKNPKLQELVNRAVGLRVTKDTKDIDLSFVQAFNIATNRTEPRNKYYHQVKRYVGIHGPQPLGTGITEDNITEGPGGELQQELGLVEGKSLPEDFALAQEAIIRANNEYDPKELPTGLYGGIRSDDDLMELSYENTFTRAFGGDGISIGLSINSLVESNVIQEETGIIYRAMMAEILVNNPEFAEHISISLDSESDRVASVMPLDGKFVLSLNPKLLKRRAVPEAVEVFAHEISHIARLMYIDTNSALYNKIEAGFQTEAGSLVVNEIVSRLFSGDAGEIRKLQSYYSSNIEEFMAEYGAFVLIERVMGNKALSDSMRKLNNEFQQAEELTNWWSSAYARLSKFTQKVVSSLNVFRKDARYSESMRYFDDMVEVMFNFEAQLKPSERPVVDLGNNDSRSYGYLVDSPSLVVPDIFNLKKEGSPYDTFNRIEELERIDRDQSQEDEYKKLLEKGKRLNEEPTLFLSQLTKEQYVRNIDKTYNTEEGKFERPKNKEERLSLALYILENALSKRGSTDPLNNQKRIEDVGDLMEKLPKNDKLKQGILNVLFYGATKVEGKGIGGGTTAGMTYKSDEPILTALAFLLDTSKGTAQNVFGGQGGGVLADAPYLKQFTRRVIDASNIIRSTFNSRTAIIIERSGYEWLVSGKPETLKEFKDSSKVAKSLGRRLTEREFEAAKNYGAIYNGNVNMLKKTGEDYNTRSSNKPTPEDVIGIRLNNQWLQDNPERAGEFITSLTKHFQTKIENSLQANGKADAITLYLSGMVPSLIEDKVGTAESAEENTQATKFYYEEIHKRAKISDAHDFVLEEIEKNAYDSNDELHSIYSFSEWQALIRGKTSANVDNIDLSYWKMLSEANNNFLRNAAFHDKKYKEMFPHANQKRGRLATILTGLREFNSGSEDTNLSTFSSTRFNHLLSNRLTNIAPNTSNAPSWLKNMQKTGLMSNTKRTSSYAHALKFIYQQGHSAILPFEDQPGELTAKEIRDLDDPYLNIGISKDLRSIMVGLERNLGMKAYQRKAIGDITGVYSLSFPGLVNILKDDLFGGGSDLDRSWRKVLDRVLHKHNLAMGTAASLSPDSESRFWTKAATYSPALTAATWGPNENMAALINEGFLGAMGAALYGGDGLGFIRDVTSNLGRMVTNVVSKKYARRWQNVSMMSDIADALYDYDAANRSIIEHNIIEYDEESLVLEEEELAAESGSKRDFRSALQTPLKAAYRKLRESQRIGPTAIKTAARAVGERIVLRRVHMFSDILEAIEGYDGPHKGTRKMFKEVTNKLGQTRSLQNKLSVGGFIGTAAGAEAHIIQLLWEAGLLTEKNIKTLKYIIKEWPPGTKSWFTPKRSGLLDVNTIRRAMEIVPLQVEGSASSKELQEYTEKRDAVYETLTALEKFQTKYTRTAITESHVLDRNVDSNPLQFIRQIYRSFPKLFITQQVLEQWGKQPPSILALKLLVTTTMDLIYNTLLMGIAGIIDQEDFERWKNGEFTKDDMWMFTFLLGRNPILGDRAHIGYEMMAVGLKTILDDEHTGRDWKRTLSSAFLPLTWLAVEKSARDALSGDPARMANALIKLAPLIGDSMVRQPTINAIFSMMDWEKRERPQTKLGGRKAQQKGTAFSSSMLYQDRHDESFSEALLWYDTLVQILPDAVERFKNRHNDMHERLPNAFDLPDLPTITADPVGESRMSTEAAEGPVEPSVKAPAPTTPGEPEGLTEPSTSLGKEGEQTRLAGGTTDPPRIDNAAQPPDTIT